MRLVYLLTAILFCQISLLGQSTKRQTERIDFPRGEENFQISGELPYADQLPFFSYFIEWSGGPLPMKIRFAEEVGKWREWQIVKRDDHNREKGITELNIGDAQYRFFELQFDTRSAQTQSAILHFFHPGETVATSPATENTTASLLACPCPQPTIQNRTQWCPGDDCPVQASPVFTEVTHLIVHHSAGTNSATDWAAIVRAIWDLHVNGNNWDDIGYNYLVDPNGVLYEGRGNDIRGAHFCGTNTGTMGVCVMGNFTSIEPTTEAITALEQLLAWKACDIDANPLESSFHASSGRDLMHISGHRDGCSTACPGDSFYPLFPTLRESVNDLIINDCAAVNTSELELPATALTLLPNPTDRVLQLQINIELNGPVLIQVLDINQRLLMSKQGDKHSAFWQDELDVQALPAGTYLLQLRVGDQVGIWRFVKQ